MFLIHNFCLQSPRHSDSDSSESHSDNEVPPSLTLSAAGGLLNNHHRHRSVHPVAAPANMTTLESVTSMALAAAFSGANVPGTTAPHLPFYAPNLLSPNWYHLARSFQAERLENVDKVHPTGEQPLDLSKGAINHNNASNHNRLPSLDTKHIFK